MAGDCGLIYSLDRLGYSSLFGFSSFTTSNFCYFKSILIIVVPSKNIIFLSCSNIRLEKEQELTDFLRQSKNSNNF